MLKREKMVKDLDYETSRNYCSNLELMYFKCGKISIFILFTLYHKTMQDSLHFCYEALCIHKSGIYGCENVGSAKTLLTDKKVC